jgi:hypothetical protein
MAEFVEGGVISGGRLVSHSSKANQLEQQQIREAGTCSVESRSTQCG